MKIFSALTLAAMLARPSASAETMVEPLRLEVPTYRKVTTHIHRPENLKRGEKLPVVLIVGGPGCKLAAALAETQRLIAIHYSPAENLPPEFHGWKERFARELVATITRRTFSTTRRVRKTKRANGCQASRRAAKWRSLF